MPVNSLKYRYDAIRQPVPKTFERLFAIDDMRSGSVKRIASAVGEGSMAVSPIHAFLHNKAVY